MVSCGGSYCDQDPLDRKWMAAAVPIQLQEVCGPDMKMWNGV
jgi:hypothetical protein